MSKQQLLRAFGTFGKIVMDCGTYEGALRDCRLPNSEGCVWLAGRETMIQVHYSEINVNASFRERTRAGRMD